MAKLILSGALTNFENFLRTFEPRFQDYFQCLCLLSFADVFAAGTVAGLSKDKRMKQLLKGVNQK
jgi:hypothetical protein